MAKPKRHPDAVILWRAVKLCEELAKEYNLLTESSEKELLYLTAENLLSCSKYAATSIARKEISNTKDHE